MNIIKIILLLLHAGSGGIGLVTGFAAILTKKGSDKHRFAGNVFTFSMSVCSLTGIILSPISGKNIFMAIGFFSGYMILTGFKAGKDLAFTPLINRMIWTGGLLAALWMLISLNMVFMSFAAITFFFLVQDYKRLILGEADEYQKRIQLHIGRIVGSLITALTAFIVVNFSYAITNTFFTLLFWLGPTVAGTVVILLYSRRYNSIKI